MQASTTLINTFQDYLKQASRIGVLPFMQRELLYNTTILFKEDKLLVKENLNYGARTKFRGNEIEISLYPFDREWLINGILAREAFNLLLPTTIKYVDASRDLGWEFARTKLLPKYERSWVDLWRKCSTIIAKDSIPYNAPFDFPLFTEVTKGEFLSDIMKIFKALEYLGKRFSEKEYIKVFLEFYQEYVYKFDAEELRIIRYLIENPTATAQDISKVFGLPYSRIYRKYSLLKKLHIITQRKRLSYSKLGLITYLVWLGNVKPSEKEYKKLLKHPALFSVFNYLDCGGGAVFSFSLPKHKENVSHFRKNIERIQKRIKGENRFIRLFLPDKAYISQSFSMLVPEAGMWVFNEESWKTWVSQFFKGSVTDMAIGANNIDVINLKNVPLYKFSTLDIGVIREIYKGNTTVRKILKNLKKSPNSIETTLKRLKQLGVVKDTLRVHYLGLTSIIFLYMNITEANVLPIVMALSEFPYVMTYQMSTENTCELLTFIRIPPQIENKVIKAIYDVINPRVSSFSMHIGRYVYWGSYKIPFDLWDEQTHAWLPYKVK